MRFLSYSAMALAAAGAVLTGPVAPAQADPGPCDQACRAAWAHQHQNGLPRTGFYDAPNPLGWASAGTLIRQEATTDYVVDGKQTPATRILYHSRTSGGRDIAVSGVVLVPQGAPPEGGWPVVADTHGASGGGVDCAPSLMRDLYHGNQMAQFVAQGYAVVAPDYAGLGTTGESELGNKTAEADDLIGAVRSARQALPNLSDQWVLWGHSQGGGAALGVAERQAVHPEPGYLGAVVTSPAADLTALITHTAETPSLGGFLPLIAQGAKASDRRVQLDRILTPQALDRLDSTHSGCLDVVSAVYSGLSGADLVRPDYLSEPNFARFLHENSTGNRPIAGPVLLLQGGVDALTTQPVTDKVATALCDTGSQIDYRTYPTLAHDTWGGQTGIDDGAMPDILSWTADRFAGKPAESTCP
ncbi:lipase family protein [Nocardia vinacea]|uniref:lipase family protein n=1 Tax=Nocardia vinacea TaxID=96468 RepID=UPI0002E99BB0|nr:lipase family protein [Nocardia vinacea]